MKKYPDIGGVDLEYRAKLVELFYARNSHTINNILSEADSHTPSNTHAYASYRIINDLSQKVFGVEYVNDKLKWEERKKQIPGYALGLLKENTDLLDKQWETKKTQIEPKVME